MTKLSPSDFTDHADWIAYVRQCVPDDEQAHTLANGRSELFIRLYRTRNLSFPSEFERELQQIGTLTEPAKTTALEQLNQQIFADLTGRLFAQVPVETSGSDAVRARTSREAIEELVQHLLEKNTYFARWKKQQASGEEQLATTYDARLGESKDAEFVSAMRDLDKLLNLFWDRNQALPSFTFERVWFLHYLHEPERMLQTRAVLHMLTTGIAICTSA